MGQGKRTGNPADCRTRGPEAQAWIAAVAREYLAQGATRDAWWAEVQAECGRLSAENAELRRVNGYLQGLARRLARLAGRRRQRLIRLRGGNPADCGTKSGSRGAGTAGPCSGLGGCECAATDG